MNEVENAANHPLHIVARGSEPANSGGSQSSGASQEDLRARLTLVTNNEEVLFESESDWPIPDLSSQASSSAEDESETDGPPLFLDEPPDLPKAAAPDTSHLDELFPDENGPAPAPQALPESMRVERRTVARPRTSVLIGVIVGGSVAGFAIAYLLLQ